jgi:hypothetical protein
VPSNFQNTREFAELTIANGGTTSTAYELGGTHLIGVLIPSAFTGNKLIIEGSIDGINFYQLYGSTSGTAKEIKVAVNRFIEIENNYDNPFNFIRLVSASVETGERKIKIICNP